MLTIAVVICLLLLLVALGSALVVWLVTRKQKQNEPSDYQESSFDRR